MTAKPSLSKQLRALANPEKAQLLARFFKTGPGQYGEGDRFLGVTMPEIRALAKSARISEGSLDSDEQLALLQSEIHEERMLALVRWTELSKKSDVCAQQSVAQLYLRHRKHINNWDLVDVTAPDVLGPLLYRKDRKTIATLDQFLKSGGLWERRIAILATFYSIRRNETQAAISACEAVLEDSEDLIHKASGWMLREIGKREIETLRQFLGKNAAQMPRTMLRYAIEKLSPTERKRWMKR